MMGNICQIPALVFSGSPHIDYGRDLGYRCEFADIAAEEAKVDADTAKGSPSVSVCLGAYLQWAVICDGMRNAGVKFSTPPPSQAAVRHFHALGVVELMQAGKVLTAAIKGAMAVGYSWAVSSPTPEPQEAAKPEPTPPPAPAVQEVHILSMPAIAISSLPERVVETTVRRDANGDLAGSTAVETDRAKV